MHTHLSPQNVFSSPRNLVDFFFFCITFQPILYATFLFPLSPKTFLLHIILINILTHNSPSC